MGGGCSMVAARAPSVVPQPVCRPLPAYEPEGTAGSCIRSASRPRPLPLVTGMSENVAVTALTTLRSLLRDSPSSLRRTGVPLPSGVSAKGRPGFSVVPRVWELERLAVACLGGGRPPETALGQSPCGPKRIAVSAVHVEQDRGWSSFPGLPSCCSPCFPPTGAYLEGVLESGVGSRVSGEACGEG